VLSILVLIFFVAVLVAIFAPTTYVRVGAIIIASVVYWILFVIAILSL
jgi:hypothetical protein